MVEVGSYAGESMELFTSTGSVKTILCIDPWKAGWDTNDPASGTDLEEAEAAFDKRAAAVLCAEVVKHKGTLEDFTLPEGAEVDLVYIDSCHTYLACKNDIELALSKLQPKIAIAGHDFAPNWPGVVKAVNETFGKPDKVYADSSWMTLTRNA